MTPHDAPHIPNALVFYAKIRRLVDGPSAGCMVLVVVLDVAGSIQTISMAAEAGTLWRYVLLERCYLV
jgi:hypothetical protein